MKPFPGNDSPTDTYMPSLLSAYSIADGAIRLAQSYTLRVAMGILQARIASRRAIVGQGGITVSELEGLSREIQASVVRIEEIVSELRRRGETVEWEP